MPAPHRDTGASGTPAARGSGISQAGESRSARIESVRAIAAVGVMFGHAWARGYDFSPAAGSTIHGRLLYGGGLGVFLLLALTGYLLYWPFVRRDFGDGGPTDYRIYARNRVLRIVPLYVVAIALLLVLQESGGSLGQWLRFGTFTANFSRATVASVDGPLWTVVMEVHFYILLPFLAFAVARAARGSLRAAAAILGVLFALSLAAWLIKVTPVAGDDRLWRYNLPANLFYFGAGMLLALARFAVERRRPRWLDRPLVGTADAWLAAAVVIWAIVSLHVKLAPLLTIASALAIGACVLPLREGPLLRALDARALALIGVASYSLYAWHDPIIENLGTWSSFPDGALAEFAIAVPLSLAVTAVSYRLIETPFLRLRKRWSPSSARVDAPTRS